MLKYIHYDQIDKNIPQDYDYNKPGKTSGKNKKTSSYKYIATAVEAMIGAIYLETNDLDKISELLLKWKEFIDKTQ